MVNFVMSNGSAINPNERGDMSAFAEGFPHEDFFMQQARKNGSEVGASDPTVGSGGVIAFIAGLISAKSIVEIGTGSGVSGLWAFRSAPSDSTLTSIDSEREHSASARNIFEEAGISAQRFRLITGNVIDVVGKLADANYDLMIVRSPKDMVDVVQESFRLLKANGVLLIDNALAGGKVADPTQRDFDTIARRDSIKAIKEDGRWRSSVLPIGGGILIASKI
jgi:predicted O-methyltransferase YrrM